MTWMLFGVALTTMSFVSFIFGRSNGLVVGYKRAYHYYEPRLKKLGSSTFKLMDEDSGGKLSERIQEVKQALQKELESLGEDKELFPEEKPE